MPTAVVVLTPITLVVLRPATVDGAYHVELPALTPVNVEPSPWNSVAVTIPATLTPCASVVTADPTTEELAVNPPEENKVVN